MKKNHLMIIVCILAVGLISGCSKTWNKTFGGSGLDYALSVQQTRDGGYIVAGYSGSYDIPGVTNHGNDDAYLVKLDATGAVVWQQMYGGSCCDAAESIQQTSDGGYIVTGDSYSTDIPGCTNHGLADYSLLKLDADGNL